MYKFKIENNKYYKKTLFGYKEISAYKYYKITDRNQKLLLKTQNFNLIFYLLSKYEIDFKNNISDFNQKVNAEFTSYKNDMKKINNFYYGNIEFEAIFLDEGGNKIHKGIIACKTSLTTRFEVTENLLSLLISRCYSGSYNTLRADYLTYNEINSVFNDVNLPVEALTDKIKCSVCNKEFDNVDEYYSHLLEENHFDKVLFDTYKCDKEILHIKEILTDRKNREEGQKSE